ncbi:30S ribosomal protein S12 methylthiotransferase RimO [Roseburia sp. MSJ-14]|uniref:30S ribosomal protein S12 methylthiotransferase RimO n=1 Tax=Roseburia sp. MSJ-14 TaxID=2841514 RepID=UPI001C128846|nr:30S ribosomal protein S12 methylthiotransferase RimO [Roseburia sp. MSJ-14]MBU5472795.1 30S ribosomal protein S12 methylthiotransferase RimO [Roseburia sp. MSJ-14]
MKILFVSLGCDKNLVDTEFMLGTLRDAGHTFTNDETEADVIVINSCCFINDAKEESINTILEMAEYKDKGSCKVLIVTGCLAERYRDEIIVEIPQVDVILGTNSYEEIAKAIEEVRAHTGEYYEVYKPLEGLPNVRSSRSLTTGGHYAHLKIAEGCNKNCTYCIIPHIRGRYRSVSMEELLKQARELAEQGVKELILVAQETTLYGVDLYGEKSLHKLLDALNEIPGIQWIRIMYCYPEEIYEELIQSIKKNKKVCHYLDMPIQHINNELLKRMGRRTTKEELIEKISHLKQEIPDITLRTTLISGFPGETQEMHEELMYFLNEMEFDRLGAFTYSPEEGTPAAEFPCQIDEEVKAEWRDEVMELQEEIIFDKNEEMKGRELWVMIEGKVDAENAYVGRTYRDAPEIDGYVFVNTDETLMTGDFVKVKITGAYEYDLIGEMIV